MGEVYRLKPMSEHWGKFGDKLLNIGESLAINYHVVQFLFNLKLL